MEFLRKLDLSGMQFLKIIFLFVLSLVVLNVFSKTLFPNETSSALRQVSNSVSSPSAMDSGMAMGYEMEDAYSQKMVNPIMPPIYNGYVPGNDAGDFEVTDYSVTIETRNLTNDCQAIADILSRADVVYENSGEYEQGCNYTFKVEKESVDEVLALIQELNPKYLNENSYTIKKEVSGYTDEIEILETKLASLDKTLEEALASYEVVSKQATNAGDIASLTSIIDSKLNMIERLNSSKLDTISQLERLNKAKTESLERLTYTYFNINVYENKFVDGQQLKDSWKVAVQELGQDINTWFQELTLGLVALMLMIVKFAIYGLILLFVARPSFTFVKKVWNNK